jgi:hypothetical protein
MCMVTGTAIGVLVIATALLISFLQWRNAQPVVNMWHQAGLTISTQSMGLRVIALWDQSADNEKTKRVQQYLSSALATQTQLMAVVLRDQSGQVMADLASDQGRWVVSELKKQPPPAHMDVQAQRLMAGPYPIWWVSEPLETQSQQKLTLEVIYNAPEDERIQSSFVSYALWVSLLLVLWVVVLLRLIWKRQIAKPLAHWNDLADRARAGVWVSDLTQSSPHPLVKASHAVIQRVHQRAQWLEWQQTQWDHQANTVSRMRGTE